MLDRDTLWQDLMALSRSATTADEIAEVSRTLDTLVGRRLSLRDLRTLGSICLACRLARRGDIE